MSFKNFIQIIVDNINLINSCLQLSVFIFPMFVIFIKGIRSFRARELLCINLGKEEFRNFKFYITTYGQKVSPVDEDSIKTDREHFNLIKFFIHDVFGDDKFGRYFIILADSGMGKSTFLQMLFLKYSRKLVRSKKIYFYPLSNQRDLSDIKEIKNKHKSIIMLDALDEDYYAVENYQKRLEEIIMATQDFYKVIITCRTQFFPDEDSEPNRIPLIKYGNGNKKLEFFKIYISVFTNDDIKKFLNKKYRWKRSKISKAKKIIAKSPDLMARPMLLAYIDDLLDKDDEILNVTDIYEELIRKWLEREREDFELLEKFTHSVVRYMYEKNLRFLQHADILHLCNSEEVKIINPILARTRSLLVRNGLGEYKFAHYSIYEYLISREAINEDNSIREKILEMDKSFNKKYFYELSYKLLRSGNKNLKFLDFSGVSMVGINLFYANLSKANLYRANLSKVNLCKAILSKANIEKAIMEDASLDGANLIGACLAEIDLQGASLKSCKLNWADLQGASLRNCKLNGADLRGANLSMADLKYADLKYTNLQAVNLTDANIDGVEIDINGLLYLFDNFKEIMKGLEFEEINADPKEYCLKVRSK